MVPHRASRPGAPAGVSAALVLLCGLSLAGAGASGGDSHGLQHGQEDRIASASSTCSAGESCSVSAASGGNGKPPRQSRKQRQPQQQQMQLGEAAAADGDDAQRFAPNPSYANLPLDGYRRQRMFPQINTGFPGLQLIHERPFLFVVNGFLSSVECALLLQKAKELTPQPGSRPDSPSDSRNSVFASAKMAGVPEFRARIANLTGRGSSSCSRPSSLGTTEATASHHTRMRSRAVAGWAPTVLTSTATERAKTLGRRLCRTHEATAS